MESNCYHCGKAFETRRDSSLYCSNSCRTGAYKFRKRTELFEKEQRKIHQEQQEKDNQRKKEQEEQRQLKAEKRRKNKEEKALKALQENDTGKAKEDHQEPVVSRPIPQPVIDSTTPEKPETTKVELPKPISITTRKKGPGLPKRDSNDNLNYKVIGYGLLIFAGIALLNKLSNPKRPPQDDNSNKSGMESNITDTPKPNGKGMDGIKLKLSKLPPLGSMPFPSQFKGLGHLPPLSEKGKIPNQNPMVNKETTENPPGPNKEQNPTQNSEEGTDPKDKAI